MLAQISAIDGLTAIENPPNPTIQMKLRFEEVLSLDKTSINV